MEKQKGDTGKKGCGIGNVLCVCLEERYRDILLLLYFKCEDMLYA